MADSAISVGIRLGWKGGAVIVGLPTAGIDSVEYSTESPLRGSGLLNRNFECVAACVTFSFNYKSNVAVAAGGEGPPSDGGQSRCRCLLRWKWSHINT